MMGNTAFQQDPGTIVRLPFDNPTLPLLLTMLGDFHRQAISYCYWKSSKRIQSVLAGEGDLDLLVARHDQHRAQAILVERGFKLFPSVAMRDHPAILSYLGYDEPSGRLIHIHLHLRLIVGERLHKNYRIPWETDILARAVPHPTLAVKILDPESEAVLLGVRACLELRRLDPVTLRGWRTTLARFELDRKRLAETLDRAQLTSRASQLLGEDLGAMLVDAVVVAADGARPDISAGADKGVAEIGQMIGFGAGLDHRLLDLDEVADVRALAEPRAGPQPGKRSDQGVLADLRADDVRERADHGAVGDRHVVADAGRVRAGHRVDDRPVLDARALAHPDPVHVAPDHGAHPDAALLADFHVADDLGAGVDEGRGMDAGQLPAVGTEHYWIIEEGRRA